MKRSFSRQLPVAAMCGVLAVSALSACAEDSTSAANLPETTVPATSPATVAAGAPTGVVVDVQALDNTFRPDRVEVAVGDEVVWTNGGRNEHDVLHVEGDDWGVTVEDFQPGDEYRHVFSEAGEYRYYCTIHGTADVGMTGTVVVGA